MFRSDLAIANPYTTFPNIQILSLISNEFDSIKYNALVNDFNYAYSMRSQVVVINLLINPLLIKRNVVEFITHQLIE